MCHPGVECRMGVVDGVPVLLLRPADESALESASV
jgi:hypothetical protein